MTVLSPVPALDFVPSAAASTDHGTPPRLEWIAIAQLGVDRAYQRDILKKGRTNVRRIVENFRWSKFEPLVVARRGDNVYSIIDGQHRAAAAQILQLPKLPCCVVDCTAEEEAEAFAAINGNVTKPNALQIFHAQLVAGDKRARKLSVLCAGAGVSIPRNAQLCSKPGETTAIGTLTACRKKYGDEVLVLALRLIVETDRERNIGMLRAAIITGLCIALKRRPDVMRRAGAAHEAVAGAKIVKLYAKAKQIQSVDGGSMSEAVATQVLRAFARELK